MMMKNQLPHDWVGKVISGLLATGVVLLGGDRIVPTQPVLAQMETIVPGIQFQPGQWLRVKVANHTRRLVFLQGAQGTELIRLNPGAEVQIDWWGGTQPNLSVIFWDAQNQSLRANVAKLNDRTLRIVVRDGWRPPGDRSVYLRDDGRISVF